MIIVEYAKTELCTGELYRIGGQKRDGKWYDTFGIRTKDGNELIVLMERDDRDELLVTWEAFNAK